ncbi:Odorant degrading enzyme CXE16 [Operophtera brumata]|uniref:Carboxylic ester hydrolase n=1 Tax=Operophtera brumata TaxID=104452 RepID=A0A0L7KNC2_OPEBR|nr:Odorant degrading enzyme CXE16 [Operophtera brumata]
MSSSSKPLPVLVYIHAGGFYSVSGRSDVAGPEYLLDRDIVLVTINYRLASLGFLSTGDALAPGNNGLKDQVTALRWIQNNIAAFGGDPNLVTISGYSAGGFSVMLHTVSPMSKGLFHRAVSMSGSPISQIQLPSHQKHLAERQAKLLNCSTDSSKAILDCLQTKSSKELGDSTDDMFDLGYDPTLLWLPIVEPDFGQERFLPMHPLEALQKGKMHSVPYIVSQTQDEFFWKAFSILNNETRTNTMQTEWHRIAAIAFNLAEPSGAAADELRRAYLDSNPVRNDSLANALAVYSPKDTYYYEFGYIGNHSHYEDPVTRKPVGKETFNKA